MADPALVRLHRKLERLSSVLTVMNTGAHPDDEASGMLAALRFGLGMRVVIACSTRGEGGQNAIGLERGAALGVLRTREMEEAARRLDADVVWLGHGPDDPVHDFGFSKNGDDTLGRWGEDRIVERLVRAYREERQDIVIPTFLDVPGQHGHHRAMTRAAERAVALAADPKAFPEHLEAGLRPWQVSKFYLPAWSGGGSTYDDEVPPPVATLVVHAPGDDVATGAPFAHIGEWSRAAHLSQGMGHWQEDPVRSWPLHLLLNATAAQNEESDIRDGLPATVGELSTLLPEEPARHLAAAQRLLEQARAAFPDRASIRNAAIAAAKSIVTALASCPHEYLDEVEHKLKRKLSEIDDVVIEASGVHVRGWADPHVVKPGRRAMVHYALTRPDVAVSVAPASVKNIGEAAPSSDGNTRAFEIAVPAGAPLTTAYPARFRVLGGNGDIHLSAMVEVDGYRACRLIDLDEPMRIVPGQSIVLDPDTVLLPTSRTHEPFFIRSLIDGDASNAGIDLVTPAGWALDPRDNGFRVSPPTHLKSGLYRLEGRVNGHPAYRSTPIAYPHIGRTAHLSREDLKVLVLDVQLPTGAKIGYVGGGNDQIGTWLVRLGFDVTDLDGVDLQGDLSRFTTIMVGIFAFGTRPDLAEACPRLHRFVSEGGHVVTFYHRPTDGWDPGLTPPRPITIGAPSLRWRVTDPRATVKVLGEDHPLMAGPNPIGPDDWEGWDKERGLYFASVWDEAYEPLLSMSDPGEKPLLGGLISGTIGHGRHTHVSLALHHQLDRLVPGAFRILANLAQPA
ncbi:LmbE family N-acetylglucosaminyl deacetylase [Microvirga subterranea]|uniref:LmbE family N-acetylglucosaminyl deacetylase n=2 Tax=Microvirga subterranea TaxID=186651 RepID=A0A370HXV3_9HYPH|nr:LmbE family N-acetylglucosaminyl deacetylase [Microvirga subterranea]